VKKLLTAGLLTLLVLGLVFIASHRSGDIMITRNGVTTYPATLEEISLGCRGMSSHPLPTPAPQEIGAEGSGNAGLGATQGDPFTAANWTLPPAAAGTYFVDGDLPSLSSLAGALHSGYTVAWYRPDLDSERVRQFQATIAASDYPDLVVLAPAPSLQGMPAGKDVRLASWTWSQDCLNLSPERVSDFVGQSLWNPLARDLRPGRPLPPAVNYLDPRSRSNAVSQ